jgi:hypothetical protein
MINTASKVWTVERQYLLPVYQHLQVNGETVEEACRAAIACEDWSSAREDRDGARETVVTMIVEGEHPTPYDTPEGVQPHAVPARYAGIEVQDVLNLLAEVRGHVSLPAALAERVDAMIRHGDCNAIVVRDLGSGEEYVTTWAAFGAINGDDYGPAELVELKRQIMADGAVTVGMGFEVRKAR